MAVHHIKIKKEAFEPTTVHVRPGDRIQFHLAGRPDAATVSVAEPVFEDDNEFVVGPGGKEKIIRGAVPPKAYRVGTMMSVAFDALGVPVDEQTGTMNGTITVIP